MSRILIEVSPGELIDRITILEIRLARLNNHAHATAVQRELRKLAAQRQILAASPEVDALSKALAAVNLALWQVEDELRLHERRGDFGAEFVQLARSVYRYNDQRSTLKQRINTLLGATVSEQKVYAHCPPGSPQ